VPRDGLRVALVCSSLDYGGAERHLLKLVTKLRDSSVVPAVVVLDGRAGNHLAPQFAAAGIDVLPSPHARNHPLTLWWLVRLLRSTRFDVAHSFLWRADVELALAARLAGFRHVICSERGDRLTLDYWSPRWRFRRFLDRQLTFRAARQLVANSTAGRDAAIRAGCPREHATVIPNWVDLAEIDGARPAASDVRRRYGLGDALVVGFVGRLAGDKGAGTFMQIAAAVAERRPEPTKFVMVGDGLLRSQIEADVRDRGLADRFVLTGAVASPFEVMHAMDVGVICSPTESLPNVLLEFMACGKPVVATAVGGLSEAIDDGRSGRLVPPGSTDAFAAACVSLLASPADRCTMGHAARETIEARYKAAPLVAQYVRLYEQVARHR
jgi:glycosyltransferase involved in cell wall biosynthesis